MSDEPTAWMVHDYPDEPMYPVVFCPVCGDECRWIYEDMNGEIVGCDSCLSEMDAYEWSQLGEI